MRGAASETMVERDFFAHPQALVESTEVGPNSLIWAFAHVMKGAVIGQNCNIGGHSFIEAGARTGTGSP